MSFCSRAAHNVIRWDSKGPIKLQAALQKDIIDFIDQARNVR